MKGYKEADGELKTYLANWERLMKNMPLKNLLMGEKIEVISRMDEEYSDISILTDGVPGFYSDYHQGWFLCSTDDLIVRFNTQNVMAGSNLSLRFLVDERHSIFSPVKIEVYKDNVLYKEVFPSSKLRRGSPRVEAVNIGVDLSEAESVTLKIYRRQAVKSSLACDEIRLNRIGN